MAKDCPFMSMITWDDMRDSTGSKISIPLSGKLYMQ